MQSIKAFQNFNAFLTFLQGFSTPLYVCTWLRLLVMSLVLSVLTRPRILHLLLCTVPGTRNSAHRRRTALAESVGTQEATYVECWPGMPFDILLKKYFPAG
jgi:hypothetical protein